MIDEKKIEEAAKRHAEEIFITRYWQACYMEGFMGCAKWMREEFLKDLWHDVFKERIPHGKRVIVEYTYKGGIYYRSLKMPDDIQWVKGFSNEKRLRRWLYIDDLLPKEEGEQ
nr:MAG TPA: hypothetical protein [Crassvirales sp.]